MKTRRYIGSQILLIFLIIPSVFGQTRLVDPEWVFKDDFEGDKDSSFWLGEGIYVDYKYQDPTNPNNNVMRMRYVPNSEGAGDSWSEYDFALGVNAVQIEMGWRQYVPSDYKHIERNHKVFTFWSGPYGKVKANISVSTEAWGSDSVGGALPSVYVGVDGNNFGHNMNSNSAPLWVDGEGKWIYVHVFLELAKDENSYGRYELNKNGALLTGTHSSTLTKSYSGAPEGNQLIQYSTRGNFIDQGTLLGWANGNDDGGFEVETIFLIDDFSISANSVHGETINTLAPKPPSNVIREKN